ncbi:hypothetical protein Tdes44962_MAKER07109 [Teratosphaeria destructans]|uniref:Uncharacterized protein n=1 Tax=Teratosphaeria destructans TaxID=418781 RepID=A0A9W7T0I1_9PEZI|nr:hypothetical protein Tdes44962_MAKER07109 [Teratosphaeria destructans]
MSRPFTPSTTSSAPTGRTRLWTFQRLASLQYLYDVGRTEHDLSNDEVATIWNRLHDVTAERSGPVEWKTLRSQMTDRERVDRKMPQAWQEVLGTAPGTPQEKARLAAEKQEQTQRVIEAIRQFKREKNGGAEEEEDGHEQDEDVAMDDASDSDTSLVIVVATASRPRPRVVARDDPDDQEGDTIVVAVRRPTAKATRQPEVGIADEQADQTASGVEQASMATRPQQLTEANIDAIADGPTNDIRPDASSLGDPFGLLDNVSVSANEGLVPPGAESEHGEYLRRAAGFYGPAEEDTDMPDAGGQ